MKRRLLVVLTPAALTLVWAAGVSSFAQDNKSRDAQPNQQNQQAQQPPAEPKRPIKPLPPEMLEDSGMSGAGRSQTYPGLPNVPRAR